MGNTLRIANAEVLQQQRLGDMTSYEDTCRASKVACRAGHFRILVPLAVTLGNFSTRFTVPAPTRIARLGIELTYSGACGARQQFCQRVCHHETR